MLENLWAIIIPCWMKNVYTITKKNVHWLDEATKFITEYCRIMKEYNSRRMHWDFGCQTINSSRSIGAVTQTVGPFPVKRWPATACEPLHYARHWLLLQLPTITPALLFSFLLWLVLLLLLPSLLLLLLLILQIAKLTCEQGKNRQIDVLSIHKSYT